MRSAITRDRYDAVLLDLDDVITDTANMHATCWKQMFDAYLQQHAAERGEPYTWSIIRRRRRRGKNSAAVLSGHWIA